MSTFDVAADQARRMRNERLADLERRQRAPNQQPAGRDAKPMPTTGNAPKRTGLTRALAAVKAQGSVDAAMDGLADMAERNNARAIDLAQKGVASETAKAGMLDQMEREQQLDELEKLIGSNAPPLGDTSQPSPPATPKAGE